MNPANEHERHGIPHLRGVFLAALAVVGLVIAAALIFSGGGNENHAEAAVSRLALDDIPFNGRRAFDYLKQICELGPRPSGSNGMTRQQKLLADHFTKLGAEVQWQKFAVAGPRPGEDV